MAGSPAWYVHTTHQEPLRTLPCYIELCTEVSTKIKLVYQYSHDYQNSIIKDHLLSRVMPCSLGGGSDVPFLSLCPRWPSVQGLTPWSRTLPA